MSNKKPRNTNPNRRRRIAGERNPVRVPAAGPALEEETPEPAAPGPGREAPATSRRPARAVTEPTADGVSRAPAPPAAAPAVALAERPATEPPAASEDGGRVVPLKVLVALGAAFLALVVVAVAGWPVDGIGIRAWSEVRNAQAVQEAEQTAPAAAERAASAILSYDYRSLDTDRASAGRYMTDKYRKQYDGVFSRLVASNAAKLKAKVTAQVLASGVSAAQPGRADVLLYVNQTTVSTANGGQPQVALNRVKFSMVDHDGTWLVDDITSY